MAVRQRIALQSAMSQGQTGSRALQITLKCNIQ